MCVMTTTSLLLGEATNIRGVEMCVITTSFPLGSATKQQKRRNVCDYNNIIPFRISNKTTEKKKCVR